MTRIMHWRQLGVFMNCRIITGFVVIRTCCDIKKENWKCVLLDEEGGRDRVGNLCAVEFLVTTTCDHLWHNCQQENHFEGF